MLRSPAAGHHRTWRRLYSQHVTALSWCHRTANDRDADALPPGGATRGLPSTTTSRAWLRHAPVSVSVGSGVSDVSSAPARSSAPSHRAANRSFSDASAFAAGARLGRAHRANILAAIAAVQNADTPFGCRASSSSSSSPPASPGGRVSTTTPPPPLGPRIRPQDVVRTLRSGQPSPSSLSSDDRVSRRRGEPPPPAAEQLVPQASSSTVLLAFFGNTAITLLKAAMWWRSGSSAMLAETIHTLVDTLNQALLLLGLRQSKIAPDKTHQYGYGRAAFFWGLVSALGLFWCGAGMAVFHGTQWSTTVRHLGRL